MDISDLESICHHSPRAPMRNKDIPQEELESFTNVVNRQIVQAYSNKNSPDKYISNLFGKNSKYESLSEHDKLFVLTRAKYDTEQLDLSKVYQDKHERYIPSRSRFEMRSIHRRSSQNQPQFQFERTSNSHMTKRLLWEYVISSDNVQCMDALLRQTPLYAIHKANVPPEATWIKSAEWMQDVLHDQAARWDGQICDYNNIGKVSIIDNEASMVKVMTQIAFTMHAAELFSHCCKFAATKCTQYLLIKAPNLIHMKASCSSNRLALETALFHASPITDDLLAKGADVRREDSLNTLAEIYMKNPRPNIRLATELICQKNKDLIRKFKCNAYPNSLLNVLYRSFQTGELPKVEETIYCTEQLLDAGVDPTEKAFGKYTALDCVFQLRMLSGGSFATSEYVAGLQTLNACKQMLLPMFKGLPAGEVRLPSSTMDVRNVSDETICLSVIAELQHILDNDVHLTTIGIIFEKICARSSLRQQSICRVCGPIVKLLYTIMCTGCYRGEESDSIFLKSLVMMNTRYIKIFNGPFSFWARWCLVSKGRKCVPYGCCVWALQELTVGLFAGAELDIVDEFLTTSILKDVSKFILQCYKIHIQNGCPVTLQRIVRFVRMSRIHFPCEDDQTLLYQFLNDLLTDAQDSEYAQAVVTDLHKFIRNVLPLKTLTRQCIIKHVQWRDVKQLPLPSALIVYVRLGDISADHPVHNMNKAQLTA